jgi:hypothetical protein
MPRSVEIFLGVWLLLILVLLLRRYSDLSRSEQTPAWRA